MPGPGGQLVEREAEVDALEAALAAAAAGAGCVVLMEGPAGIGKSELLGVAQRRALESGLGVLTGRGSELERHVPFGVALELFARPLLLVHPSERQALFRGAAELAAPLFSATPPAEGTGAGDESFPVIHGLYWLLVNLAERAPLVVAVDDAHWVDRPSLRFLLYLAERVEGLPAALVVALRGEEAPAGGKPMARLRALRHARVLNPEALSKDATAVLTRTLYFPSADGEFCRAVFDVTLGNPFIVREVLHAIDLEGLPPTSGSAERVRSLAPESVVRSTRARISRLPTEAWELVKAVAVLGSDASLRHAARLAGLSAETAASAADDLVAAGVLLPGDPLDFVQPPVRTSVYSSIRPGRRATAHAAAAAILVEEEPHPERLANHLLHSPTLGNPDVVRRLRAAAQWALSVGAPDSALRYLCRALAEPPPPTERAGILVEAGRASATVGDPTSLEYLHRAVERMTSGRDRAAARYEVGRILVNQGRYREASESLRDGLDDLGDTEPCELRHRLLAALLQATRLDPGSPHRSETLGASQAAVDQEGEMTLGRRALLGELAFEWLLAGRPCQEVTRAAKRALAGPGLVGMDEGEALPFYNAVAALTWAGGLDTARDELDRALEEAERYGRVMGVATASFRRAVVAYLRGAVADSVSDAQRAVDAARAGWAAYLPAARAVLALGLIELGELLRAAAVLDPPDPPQGRPSPTQAMFLNARACLHLVEGSAAEALADARAAGRIMTEDLGSLTPAIVPWRSTAAVAQRQLGDAAEAQRLAAEEVELARAFGAPRPLGMALRAHGVVERGARGVEILREAVATLAASPARLEHARALADLGGALRRAGRRSEAQPLLREGLRLAERCGAMVLAERLTEELQASRIRSGRRALVGVGALTPGEQRVARLAADGLTNKEIAQKLFVSVRAVEFHLGNVYTKLGISRRGLGAALKAVQAG